MVVTTSPLIKRYTLEEFWALPEPKDRSKLELIGGVLYMTPPPDSPHDFSASRLYRLFARHLDDTNDQGMLFMPRAALWTSENTYLEPDMYYVSEKTLRRLDPQHRDRADLVVEILSPGSQIYDRNTKADTYAALRVRELWLVDPVGRTVEVRVLKRGTRTYAAGKVYRSGQRVRSTVLPDFSPAVDDIFKRR
jgi:Uma2 family endonuclease